MPATENRQALTANVDYAVVASPAGRRARYFVLRTQTYISAMELMQLTGLASERDNAIWLEEQLPLIEELLTDDSVWVWLQSYVETDRDSGRLPLPNPEESLAALMLWNPSR